MHAVDFHSLACTQLVCIPLTCNAFVIMNSTNIHFSALVYQYLVFILLQTVMVVRLDESLTLTPTGWWLTILFIYLFILLVLKIFKRTSMVCTAVVCILPFSKPMLSFPLVCILLSKDWKLFGQKFLKLV